MVNEIQGGHASKALANNAVDEIRHSNQAASSSQLESDPAENKLLTRTRLVWCLRTAVLVMSLLVWEILSGTIIDPFFISRPTEVANELWRLIVSGSLLFNTIATLQEATAGYFIGASLAIVSGFLLGRVRIMGETLDPFIIAFFSIPKLALAPLIILWFGIGFQSKVVLSALLTFYLTFWNTYAGVQKVDLDLINVARVMGASRWQLTKEVILPSSVGWILVGLRMSVPYALMGAVVGEIMAGNRGLGYLVQASANQFNTPGVFAVLIVLAVMGSIVNQLVAALDRRTQRWNVLSD